jgi:hypothetical protein
MRRFLAFALALLFACSTMPRLDAQMIVKRGPIVAAGGGGGVPDVTASNTSTCVGAPSVTCTVAASSGAFVCAGVESGNTGPPTLTITDSAGTNTWTAMGSQVGAGGGGALSGFAMKAWCSKLTASITSVTLGGIDSIGRGAVTVFGTNPPSSSTAVASGTNSGNSVATDTVLTMASYTIPANSLVVTLAWALGDGLTPTATGYKCGISGYTSGACTIGANAFFHFIWKYETSTATGSITASQSGSQVWGMISAAYQ